MRKLYFHLLAIFLALPLLTACSEEETPDLDYYNWAQRNTTYFTETLSEAKAAVSAAKAAYGADWENHCDWRVFRTYLKTDNSDVATTDSICAKVIERGAGAGCPLYTDSVRVNYIGRTMPTLNYPEGRVFDHSGIYSAPEEVFNNPPPAVTSKPPVRVIDFRIWATNSQLQALKAFLMENGIKYGRVQ